VKLQINLQLYEKFGNVRSWVLLTVSNDRKYFKILQLWTCKKLGWTLMVLFGKRFRFNRKK